MEQTIRDEVRMEQQIKQETKEPKKLLSPKACILIQARRRPHTTDPQIIEAEVLNT